MDELEVGRGESSVARYIEGLAAGGRVVCDGLFTLDAARAREQLMRYQLPNPHEYVVEFVQAAHLLGASYVVVRAGAGWVEVGFDGALLRVDELEQLFSAAFARRLNARERALRHLALGLNALFLLRPRSVSVSVCDGSTTEGVVLYARSLERAAAEVGHKRGTLIRVRKRIGVDLVRQGVQAAGGELPEFVILANRGVFAEIPILVNGQRVSRGMRGGVDACAVHVPVQTPWERGWLGVRRSSLLSVISVLQHGVLVAEHRLSVEGFAVRAVVDSSRLNRSLSQRAFVQDEVWDAFMDEVIVGAWHEALLLLLERDFARHQWPEGIAQIVRLVFAQIGRRRARGEVVAGATRRLALILEHVPMWLAGDAVDVEAPSWRPVLLTMRELGVSLLWDAPLMYTRVRQPQVRCVEGRNVLQARADEIALLEAYLGRPALDMTQPLEDAVVRANHEARWRAQPLWRAQAEVQRQRYGAGMVRVELEGYEIFVGLDLRGSSQSELRLYHQGRLLKSCVLEGAPLPRIVIALGATFEVTPRFDGVVVDAGLKRALWAALMMIPSVVEAYVDAVEYVDERVSEPLLMAFMAVDAWWLGWLRALEKAGLAAEVAEMEGLDAPGAQLVAWVAQGRAAAGFRVPEPVILGCGALSRLPMFEVLGAGWSRRSLLEVYEAYRAHGEVAWVDVAEEAHALRLWRLVRDDLRCEVLVLGPEARRALTLVFGVVGMRAFEPELERLVCRQQFLQLAKRDLKLGAADGVFLCRSSSRELSWGQIGLMAQPDEVLARAGVVPGELEVVFCYEQRVLARRVFTMGVGRAKAVVDAAGLTVCAGWDDVVEDARYEAAVAEIYRAVDATIAQFVARCARLLESHGVDEVGESLMVCWGLYGALCVQGRALLPGACLAADVLKRARLFCLAGQVSALSHEALLLVWGDVDDARYVWSSQASAVDEQGWLVVPVRYKEVAAALMERLFEGKHGVVLWQQRAYDERALQRAFHAYLERSPALELSFDGALAWLMAEGEGGDVARVALFAEEEPSAVGLEVSFVQLDREVMRRRLRRRWWRVQVQLVCPSLIDWSCEAAPALAKVRALLAWAERLETQVIEAWAEREVVGSQRAFLSALWRARHLTPWREVERAQDARLFELPCFTLAGGERCSFAQLDASVGRDGGRGERAFLLEGEPERVEDVSVDALLIDSLAVLAPLRALWPEVWWRRVGMSSPSAEEGAEVYDGEVAPRPRAMPEGRDDGALMASLGALLAWVRGDEEALLWESYVHMVCADEPWGPADGEVLAIASAARVSLNREHRAFTGVTAHVDDPVWGWFWASAIYSAINAYEREITDDHELAFQARFARAARLWSDERVEMSRGLS